MTRLTKNTVPPPQECGVLFSNSCFFATRIPTQPAETQNYSLHVCKSNLEDRDASGMAKFIDPVNEMVILNMRVQVKL